MSLRTRLILAFLVLAVVPLLSVSVYSYLTSLRAFRLAVERETSVLADEMGARSQAAGHELARRLEPLRDRVRTGWSPAFLEARRLALATAERQETTATLVSVLSGSSRARGEIPFAIDAQGELLVAEASDRAPLIALRLVETVAEGQLQVDTQDWLVVFEKEPVSGATLGVARPIGGSLGEIRDTAVRNLAWGLVIVGVALLGILPLSRHMTRNLQHLAEGAERLAQGDLSARVPVRSSDEFGQLAETFNRMAVELTTHQERALAEERLRRELEMCRRIQEELLPRAPLLSSSIEIRGESVPATEVGGDFFNYFPLESGSIGVLLGDVSGKGIAAALLMANLQATLRARLPLARDLARLATELDEELFASTPGSSYVTLFLAVLEPSGRGLRWVNAGHNPPYVLRRDGHREGLEATGRPLGLLPGGGYEEREARLDPEDRLFLYTDGVTEAEDPVGEPFGPARLLTILQDVRALDTRGLIRSVTSAVEAHRGPAEPGDDATMLVVQLRSLTLSPILSA